MVLLIPIWISIRLIHCLHCIYTHTEPQQFFFFLNGTSSVLHSHPADCGVIMARVKGWPSVKQHLRPTATEPRGRGGVCTNRWHCGHVHAADRKLTGGKGREPQLPMYSSVEQRDWHNDACVLVNYFYFKTSSSLELGLFCWAWFVPPIKSWFNTGYFRSWDFLLCQSSAIWMCCVFHPQGFFFHNMILINFRH